MTIRVRQGRAARDVLLTLGAVLGVMCILATVASAVFDVKPLVFRSGSMSPAIRTGDLAIAREVDASQLERGDIVSVVNAAGSRVTHRLVASTERDGATQLVLKGDANKAADAEVYTATRARKVLFDVPKAGYVVNAAASPGGVFVLGLFVAWMVTLIVRSPRGDRSDGPGSGDGPRRGGARRLDRSTRSRSAMRSAFVATTVGSVAIASPAAAAAEWTDAVVATGTTMTAYTVPVPGAFACSGSVGNGVNFTWNAVTGATSYTLHYASGTKTVPVAGTSQRITELLTLGGTAWVVANVNYGSTTWTSAASSSKSYTIAVGLVGLC